MFEFIPEAMTMFRRTLNLNGMLILQIYELDILKVQREVMTLGNYILNGQNENGTAADKAALYIANIARTLNNNKLFGWSPRALAAVDDTFKWLMVRSRSKEKASSFRSCW